MKHVTVTKPGAASLLPCVRTQGGRGTAHIDVRETERGGDGGCAWLLSSSGAPGVRERKSLLSLAGLSCRDTQERMKERHTQR